MRNFITTFAAISCMLPMAVLAAPAAEPGITEASSLDPHFGCYATGESFTTLANTDNIAKTVAAGCGVFGDFPTLRTYNVGTKVSWCHNTIGGKGSLNFAMTYKGTPAGDTYAFTPTNGDQDGGLAQYCWVAMEWARTTCKYGGKFTNHELGNSQGPRVWDVVLDPNSAAC